MITYNINKIHNLIHRQGKIIGQNGQERKGRMASNTESYTGRINRKLNKKLRIVEVAAGRQKADRC